MNAVATSYRLADSLVMEEGLRGELSVGEKTRARHLLARSALRSGQTRRGISLYLDLFAESPAVVGTPDAEPRKTVGSV